MKLHSSDLFCSSGVQGSAIYQLRDRSLLKDFKHRNETEEEEKTNKQPKLKRASDSIEGTKMLYSKTVLRPSLITKKIDPNNGEVL